MLYAQSLLFETGSQEEILLYCAHNAHFVIDTPSCQRITPSDMWVLGSTTQGTTKLVRAAMLTSTDSQRAPLVQKGFTFVLMNACCVSYSNARASEKPS